MGLCLKIIWYIFLIAMLALKREADVRMAVLEEKLSVYEDLSREMLAKLESAVDKISEANQNVAKILVRHEERLDQGVQSNAAIMKLLEDIKYQRKEDMTRLGVELDGIRISADDAHKKISELSKYRWIFAGVIVVLSFIASEINVVERAFMRPSASPAPYSYPQPSK